MFAMKSAPATTLSRRITTILCSVMPLLLAACVSGCGSGKIDTAAQGNAVPSPTPLPGYFSVPIYISNNELTSAVLGVYSIDHTAGTYSFGSYSFNGTQQGYQVYYSGTYSTLNRGLLALATTYTFPQFNGTSGTIYDPPQLGNFAVELPGQAGGFVQLNGSVVTPLGSTQSCPDLSTPKTYQFVTLPLASATSNGGAVWNPQTMPAYGTARISNNGNAVTVDNIQQHTMPGGTLATPAPTSVAGACAQTVYGNTISAPNPIIITKPGPPGGTGPATAQAMFSIGASGMLAEYSGTVGANYANVMGAGTGAVGLPQPSQPMDTSALVSAQYQGFILGQSSGSPFYTGSLSEPVSFGFPSPLPATCNAITASTSTLIYGGDYPGNNPGSMDVQAAGGYGNCNLAIDLGLQDPNNNGTYPNAKVYFGSSFPHASSSVVSFPAVAIASQLTLPGQTQGTYAIFLIGVGNGTSAGITAQPWTLYLLQSQ